MARGQKKEKKELTPEERLQNALVPKEEWPYELPEGWKWVYFTGLIDIQGGTQPPKSQFSHICYPGYVRLVQIRDFATDRFAVYVKDSDKLRHFKKDDIMIARYGASLGRICRGMEGVYNVALAKTIFSEKLIERNYLYWLLQSEVFQMPLRKISRTAQVGFNKKDLSTFLLPLPPIKIQRKIAMFIDCEFARLDEATEQIQSVLDSSEERKQSILHKAFTGELTDKWRKENGVSLDSWHKEKLKSICDINPKKEDVSGYDDDMEVSFFPMASLDERVGAITNPQIRPLKDVKKGFTNFREGDVVFAKITPCMENGKSAVIGKLVNDIGYGTTEFYVFRCGGKIDRYYLFHLLRSQKFRDDAKQEMTGAVGQQRVPKKYLENYEVNLPSTDEQKEIVRLLNSFIEKEDEIEDASEQIVSNMENNKKSILSKAFRGELHL